MRRALTIAGFAVLLLIASGFVYSGFIHVWQNAGSNIGTFTTYEVVNCSTGMSCSKSGSVITMTATGSGVSSVSGTASQITSSGGTTPTLSLPVAITAPGSLTATTSLAATTSVSGASYLTATNCAGVGTAANPSVVTCTAAAAGAFSCATAATTGTCTINTTAVTANSEIFVIQTSSESARLSVTCNTAFDLSASAPLLASKSLGVSFTINLGTVAVNPACFDYFIVN